MPAGDFLPPRIVRRQFIGPDWATYRGTALNYGALSRFDLARDWTLRGGIFRSLFDDRRSFSNLLVDLQPDGTATQVTWAMSGQNNYLSKLMQIFFSMERMVGDDFAAGLANLKALAEAP